MDEPTLLTPSDFPNPETSRRGGIIPRGNDLLLADGNFWTLADFVPTFGDVWDRIYDDNLLATHYDRGDMLLAGVRLLLANYDLPADFAAWLIQEAEIEQLRDAVEAAIFGQKDQIRTWSKWAQAALWANGIDPATLPAQQLRPVLDQLVMAGRAAPSVNWTTAGQAYRQRKELDEQFKNAGIKPSPYVAPPSKPEP